MCPPSNGLRFLKGVLSCSPSSALLCNSPPALLLLVVFLASTSWAGWRPELIFGSSWLETPQASSHRHHAATLGADGAVLHGNVNDGRVLIFCSDSPWCCGCDCPFRRPPVCLPKILRDPITNTTPPTTILNTHPRKPRAETQSRALDVLNRKYGHMLLLPPQMASGVAGDWLSRQQPPPSAQ